MQLSERLQAKRGAQGWGAAATEARHKLMGRGPETEKEGAMWREGETDRQTERAREGKREQGTDLGRTDRHTDRRTGRGWPWPRAQRLGVRKARLECDL